MSRGLTPGTGQFQQAYDARERNRQEERHRDRAMAIWSALSPQRRMQNPGPGGMIRFGAWRVADARRHPLLRDLVGRALRTDDAQVTIAWQPGSDSLNLTITLASGKTRNQAVRL